MKYHQQKGFTLIEAIVALVLISLTGMAIFQWLNQSMANLRVLEREQSTTLTVQNALAYIKTINPMENPTGKAQVGNMQLEWESDLLEEPTKDMTQKGSITQYTFGLYQMDVTLTQTNQPKFQFSVRQVGYKP